ncbi:MAG: CdaR family protein, partial [Acutalibacteraceae bacterium]|nr:CdaR family protein [Acutalibacteraceae bacterium]
MKIKFKLNDLFNNDKFLLFFSLFAALVIWLLVVVNVSEATTRVIQGVKVNIDSTVPSQFGLEVFGKKEFTVDVTVKGKKYQISPAALSAEDIVITAQTNNVDSAGNRTLQLKPEIPDGADYTITTISEKNIDVYFDTAKTVQMVIEPQVVADGFPIVSEGYTSGNINLSETSVTVTGPSTEINRIEKVVAKLVLKKSLSSNKSADAEIVLLNDKNKSDFKYVTLSKEKVVLTIPVLQMKELETIVAFKNAPDNFMVTPLSYTVSPAKDLFNISVDDYDKTVDFTIGTIDFKTLSPSNHVFTFLAEDIAISESSETEEFTVNVDMTGISQEYITYSTDKFIVNNPDKKEYKIAGLNKSVVVVGAEKDLESITEDAIKVEIDLSEIDISKGQSVTVPAVVAVD